MESLPAHTQHLVIGAGPAGLTAGFELARNGAAPLILEASPFVGGLARTHLWDGNRIDIGGHRFFTKSKQVNQLWVDMMDEPMLKVPRLSRIFYKEKFYQYPLQIPNTLGNLGLVDSFLMLWSYARARLTPIYPEDSFQDWVINRFGKRLYHTFFKTYTEKVWGLPCTEIRADWAAQRIHGLNLASAVLNSLRNNGKVKSLVKTFDYPRLGPGMLWESAARKIGERGGRVVLDSPVARLRHLDGRITSVEVDQGGVTHAIQADQIISTMPLSTLVKRLEPPAPPKVLEAATSLKYRDFLIVALACEVPDIFPDNWIYIHSGKVRVGRIQNFRNWSPDMVAEGNGTTLGMEYFCSRGDDLWTMADDELIALAKRELASLGLADESELGSGYVIRQLNAYPVYDSDYMEHVCTLKGYLENFSNLQSVGRNGMHRYNNQDHSMLAGQYAALRLLGRIDLDPWKVNTERSYYEEQLIARDKKHSGMEILASEKASPHQGHKKP